MNKNKITSRRTSVALMAAVVLTMLFSLAACSVGPEKTEKIISSYDELKSALKTAKDGDTLLVGDIDFTPSGNMANFWMRLDVDKNLTIKSGKPNEKAVFLNGSFVLLGNKTPGTNTSVRFENISFDGNVDVKTLVFSDFECPWDEEEQRYVLSEPRKAQFAICFKGNVDATFDDCDFKNYMHEYGPIMQIRYGDYTDVPSLRDLFPDYSTCILDVKFNRCNITGNAAGYGGGAIYVDSNNNVTLTAVDCNFANNLCGGSEFSLGGGAIYADGTKLTLERCAVENNVANYPFEGVYVEEDTAKGGGLYVCNSKLTLKNSTIIGNMASMGGGIALTDSAADMDGCVFTKNRAATEIESPYGDVGPWTNMGQGGAIYHEGKNGSRTVIVNSNIFNNSAKTAYGGIYSYYTETSDLIGVVYVDIMFSNHVGNTVDLKYDYSYRNDAERFYPWASHPGDLWSIPHINASACIVVDDSFEADFVRHELPSESNGYNYYASSKQAAADGLEVSSSDKTLSVKAPKGIDFSVPDKYSQSLLEGRYQTVKKLSVGSNYTSALYGEKKTNKNVALYVILAVAGVLVAVAFGAFGLRRKANCVESNECISVEKADGLADGDDESRSEKHIVKAWFTAEEIDVILKSYPKIQTLTGRETEVLWKMLDGKKQKEIAYELGIEITTVKDFYRKIYDKLDFVNKDDMLRKFSEICSK